MTQSKFAVLVEEVILPAAYVLYGEDVHKVLIVMDNCPAHKGHLVASIIDNGGCDTFFLPPKSPDLNPVENVWAYISKNMEKRCARNKDDLINMVMDSFRRIPESYFEHLLHPESIKRRLKAVKDAGGYHTRY
ncbi:MAG TPA: transposase [Methylomirabilota bacterium]|nr:transposase [Methylomirabilota bacterium]